MVGWILFHAIQVIAYLFIIAIGVFWVVTDFWPNYIQPKGKATQQNKKLRASGVTIHTEQPKPDLVDPDEDFQPISVDEARAGQVISNVPNYDPKNASSWKQDRTVVATASARVFTPQGVADTLFIWLSGDMLIMKTPKKWRLLTELPISSSEAQTLLDEREALLHCLASGLQPDVAIKSFKGCSWTINGVYGRNEGRNPGQSTIECTSVISDLGEFADDVPTLAIERGRPVAYFDLRADFVAGDPSFTDRTLLAMWAEEGNDCVVYVGRDLNLAEVKQMGVV